MDETDFHNLVSPKFKTQEDIKDDKILMVNEVVNVTMPIIDSTYVNHHLDKSLLMVRMNFIHFYACLIDSKYKCQCPGHIFGTMTSSFDGYFSRFLLLPFCQFRGRKGQNHRKTGFERILHMCQICVTLFPKLYKFNNGTLNI